MKISQKQLDMARQLLAQPEERKREDEYLAYIVSPLTENDIVYEYQYEEAVVRARLSDTEIAKLMGELKLNPLNEQSWEVLENMTQWLEYSCA